MQASILKTLAYADIFDYPLTLTEINHWLISPSSVPSVTSVLSVITSLSGRITQTGNYYTLPGRSRLVKLRQARSRFSREKLQLAHRVREWLKSIPTIKLVAVTGALAMRNSDPNDDIDLMIVTSPNTLWLTRLLVVPLISLIAKRRTPTKNYSNAVCLNLWLDETALAVPSPKRNLYTAHEVAQVKPLWSRADAHHRFLSANSWIKKFLPNITIKGYYPHQAHTRVIPLILEKLAYKIQLWYMKPKMTTEKVSLHSAFFHPRDTSRLVMRQYHRRLVNLGIKP